MQSWHAVPDGTDPDSGHGSWPSGYGFPDQASQYENSSQTWSQPLAGQPMYTSVGPNEASNTGAFYSNNTPQGGAILDDGLNGVSSVPQGSFAGQGGLPQYRPDQDVYNMGFESLQQDSFGQQGKLDLGQGLGDLARAPPHQGQTSSQGFVPASYGSYPSSDDQAFGTGLAMPTPSKMLSGNAPTLDRVPQQPQHHQQKQPQPQQQQLQHPFQPSQVYPQPPQQHLPHPQSLEHTPQPYSPSVTPQGSVYQALPGHGHPLNQQQAQLQSHAYLAQHPGPFPVSQGSGAAQDGVKQFASTPVPAAQQNVLQSAPAVSTPPTAVQALASQGAKRDAELVGTPQSAQDSSEQGTPTEPAPKKRKRVLKKTPEPQGAGMLEPHHTDVLARKAAETDTLPLPGSNDDDVAVLDAFRKRRTVGATSRFPPLQGAPRLATAGTIKLPTPKSYDKLAPLVAMPSQSGKPITPEVGRSLPCEIQGTFSAKFKPSPDGAGLEDRRREAKDALAEYDRSMEALGNHRPKYTEYPHAFKEQLKTDEALKTKAERLARKLAEEERNKPVRSETRPSDPMEGAAWDIIGYVHIPPSATRTTSLLAGAVQQAGEYIIARRGEMTRAKLEVDQASKDKNQADLPALTAAAELKKEVLYRTLDATNKVGDEAVLENLGGHGKLVLSLVNLLVASIRSGDFSGKLPKAALSLMANFKMTKKVATQTKFDNIRRRLADKGDTEVNELLDTIASRIRKEPDADASPKKPAAAPSTSETKTKPTVSKPSTDSLSTKRARVDDTDSRATKKQAVESSGSAQPVASKASAPTATQPKMAPAKVPRPTGGILPGKSRPASKPVSKPVATTKAEPAKAEPARVAGEDKLGAKVDVKKPAAKPEPKPEAARPSKPSSSGGGLGGIASLLDSINAPKAKPKPAPEEAKEEPVKEETPEEREKRLRKQSRRRLRVSWKGDDELEEVRFFHKEAEEEEGFDSRMTRDAGDDKREGMALKQRGMIMDEDEDEDEDDGIPYRPWLEPTPLDFSSIPAEYRKKTYQTRGGDIVVETDEQKAIAEREQTVLMAIYTDAADIPPTPKSPSIRAVQTSAEMKIGHLPRDDPRFEEVHRRWKEVQQLGRDAALQYVTKRIESKKQPSSKVNSTTAMAGPDPHNSLSAMSREDQVLLLLANDRVKQWRDTKPLAATNRRYDYPDPRVQYAADLVEDLVPKLNGPYPATEPPAWIKDTPEAVREWWHGYNRDATAKAKKDADDKARVEAEQMTATQNQAGQDAWAAYYAHQQQAYAPYMAILQQLQGGQGPVPSAPVAQPGQAGNNDPLQAVLAALGPGQTQGGPAAATLANAAPQLNPTDPTYQQLMMLSQLAQQPQQSQDLGGAPTYGSAGNHDWDRERDRDRDRDWDRERDRDRDRDRDYDAGRGDRGDREDRRGGQRKHKGTLPPHRPVNRALIGTKPCVFYKQGTCARGDQCTFRHE